MSDNEKLCSDCRDSVIAVINEIHSVPTLKRILNLALRLWKKEFAA